MLPYLNPVPRSAAAPIPTSGSSRERPPWRPGPSRGDLILLLAVLVPLALVILFLAARGRHLLGAASSGGSAPGNTSSHGPADIPGPEGSYGGPTVVVGSWSGALAALRTDTGDVVWHRPLGGQVDTLVRSAAVVYVSAESSRGGAEVFALRASDGGILWQVTEPQLQGYTFLALDGDRLFADGNDGDGTVYALDAATGRVLWTYANHAGRDDMLLAAQGGTVYVAGVSSGFAALDAATGNLRWSSSAGPPPVPGDNGAEATLLATDSLVYDAGQSGGSITALDVMTGAVQATLALAPTDRVLAITPEGVALLGRGARFCAVRVADGAQLWCATGVAARWQNVPLYTDEVTLPDLVAYAQILPPTDGVPHQIVVGALDLQTGASRWQWQTPAPTGVSVNAPNLVGGNGVLYLAAPSGLYALRASDGHLLWHGAAEEDLSFVVPAVSP